MKNLKIGVRLGIAFGALLFLLTMVAYIGWSSLSNTKMQVDVIVNEHNAEIAAANAMRGNLNIVARAVRNYILYSEKNLKQSQLERIANARQKYDEDFKKLGSLIRDEKSKLLYTELQERRNETRPLYNKIIEMVDAGNSIEDVSGVLGTTVQPSQDKWFNMIAEMIALQEKLNRDAIEKMNQEYDFTTNLLLVSVLVAVTAGAILTWFITRSITVPINQAVKLAQTVAAGDLTSHIEVTSGDEVGQLLQALKDMNGSLQTIVDQVRSGTDTIATASSQIASGNLDLSSRTEQQASSLEETASSMEELTSTVKQNSDNARQANQLAVSASDVAVKGGMVVAQVVDTMVAINDSAKKIVDIIGVIDGIAFQTNILALNAAVEAARAGEQGRGFAVVASEVRTLAQRSAGAAKEIKALIGDSVEKVDAGSKLVNHAGATMDEIVASVKRVTDIMGEITSASKEQEVGIEQINQAISEMDTVTQQNAALVEQAAAAAESLQDQAGNLVQVVSIFKVDGIHTAKATSVDGFNSVVRAAPVVMPFKRKPIPVRITANNSVRTRKFANEQAATNDGWEEF
ncbi:methyl-accepting chemotaxis protein [Undibacterium sp. SXout7W]|uniref:methyl-accepting chemotaxis protein n=1 Tax=Undibacterium sp. SXout7W TaxID=3413049 RepID=UPI003BF26D4B